MFEAREKEADQTSDVRKGQRETSGVNAHTVFAGFVIAFGSSFQQGYNIGVLNQVSTHINTFFNDTYKARRNGVPLDPMHVTLLWSFTTAVMFIPGGIVGAFLGAWLADALGRKRGILVSHVFIIIGIILSVICVPAKSPELLMLGRVFVGIQCAIGNCIAPMYLQEIVQPNLRGAFGTLHQLAITIGNTVSSIFGLSPVLGAANRWQYLMLLEMAPVVTSYACLPFIKESPRFLLLVRKDAEGARRSLEFYRKSKEVDDELNEMDVEGRAMESQEQRTIRQMLASDIRMAMFICCMLQLIQQLSGISCVFFYSYKVYEKAGVDPTRIPYAIIGTNALNLVMTVIAVPLMDIAGRRKLLLFPIAAMIFILSFLTVCLDLQTAHPFTAHLSIVCVLLYVSAFAVGLGPIPLMVGSELFRQDARSKAMAVGGIVNLAGTFIIGLGFEPVQNILHHFTFVIFIGCLFFSFFFVYFLVPETKNRTFEEVAAQLSEGRGRSHSRKVAPPDAQLDTKQGATILQNPILDTNDPST